MLLLGADSQETQDEKENVKEVRYQISWSTEALGRKVHQI